MAQGDLYPEIHGSSLILTVAGFFFLMDDNLCVLRFAHNIVQLLNLLKMNGLQINLGLNFFKRAKLESFSLASFSRQ